MACANKKSEVYTFEGSNIIADIASQNFIKAGLQNINLIRGNFDETFLDTLETIQNADFAFIDGNHRKNPTLYYFSHLQNKTNTKIPFLFLMIFTGVQKWRKRGSKYNNILL